VQKLLETAQALSRAHRVDEALDVIEYGLRLAPGHGELLFGRGKALQDLGSVVCREMRLTDLYDCACCMLQNGTTMRLKRTGGQNQRSDQTQ
jgi:hypothetical protein